MSKNPFGIILLSWLGMSGIDFLLHGGLLAWLYVQESPFLLSPQESFKLIPLGYLAFLLLAVLLYWLMRLAGVAGARAGLEFGLKLGGLVCGALLLGLISISTISLPIAAGWFVGQTAELGLGGAIIGRVAETGLTRGLTLRVIAGVVICLILTIVLQSAGFAPVIKIN